MSMATGSVEAKIPTSGAFILIKSRDGITVLGQFAGPRSTAHPDILQGPAETRHPMSFKMSYRDETVCIQITTTNLCYLL